MSSNLALVTVTHNSGVELRALLGSAEQYLPGTRVVCVDCASSDDSVAVAEASAVADSVALDENLGFGRGCNRGLEEVHEAVTALVNPDVELLDDSLLILAAEALRDDCAERVLAPLVRSPDGSRQDTVHPAPLSASDLVGALFPLPLIPGAAPWRARAPRRVGWAVGCALVARTDTFRRLGPFDERIFMYSEDLDLGLRAARAGIATWFDPRAQVLHHQAHSTSVAYGGEPFQLRARARHDVVARHFGAAGAAVDDAAQALTFSTRILGRRLLGRPWTRERRQLHALSQARRPR